MSLLTSVCIFFVSPFNDFSCVAYSGLKQNVHHLQNHQLRDIPSKFMSTAVSKPVMELELIVETEIGISGYSHPLNVAQAYSGADSPHNQRPHYQLLRQRERTPLTSKLSSARPQHESKIDD